MGEWILLEDERELEKKVKEIKRECTGSLQSNYIFINSALNKQLLKTEAFYREDGLNITLIKRWDNFYYLYYFIGDIDTYRMVLPNSVENGTLVCEMIEREGKEKYDVINKLKKCGFNEYKRYFLWEFTKGDEEVVKSDNLLLVSEEYNRHELCDEIYRIFDHYSDRLPLTNALDDFFEEMRCLVYMHDGKRVGIIIYSLSGSVATQEFTYTLEEVRGKGYARLMEKCFVEYCVNSLGLNKVRGWIESRNEKSMEMVQSANWHRTNRYKLTLRRG